jgi:hypothetical protein
MGCVHGAENIRHVLQAMMQPLQNLCGIDPCATATFRRIWMAILSDSSILTLDFAR